MKILYVEDDPDIAEVGRIALETVGEFEVELCSTGLEAVHRAHESSPDLILLDVVLPDVDGLTVLEQLRKLPVTGAIPVVLLTARTQKDEMDRFRDLGVREVIVKPFDPIDLCRRMRQFDTSGDRVTSPPRADIIRRNFISDWDDRLSSIKSAWAAYLDPAGPQTRLELDRLWNALHQLAGGAGILGYAELADSALEAEQIVRELPDRAQDALPERVEKLRDLLELLDQKKKRDLQ